MRTFHLPLLAALSSAWLLATAGTARSSDSGLSSAVLRHRVVLVAVPPSASATNQPQTAYLIQPDLWKALLVDEGLTISDSEWSSAVDLTKSRIASSPDFRLVELQPGSGQAAGGETRTGPDPALIIIARFAVRPAGYRVMMRLIDQRTGTVVADADNTAADLTMTIDEALAKISESAALMAWRCRVVDTAGDLMIIDRGRLDGVRNGQLLTGYELKKRDGDENIPDELLLMKSGRKTGSYKVVEEGQDFSKVEAVDQAPALKAGDLLELPAVFMRDRGTPSRGKRMWDRLYGD